MFFKSREEKRMFTIIMAIYDVEEYIKEAIESVINQTLNFRKHVQLILVNDGSKDGCESICLEYQRDYPENIIYILKENGGVSSARNEGLKYAVGKYINFLDPDDKLSLSTLEEVFKFFEDNYDKVDVVSIPIKYFELKNGDHLLNYKFQKNEIVNLDENYTSIQLSAPSSFIKSSELQSKLFETNMTLAEDAELVNTIIIKKMRLGLVCVKSMYYYRVREKGSSALQTSSQKKEWYIESLDNFSDKMIKRSINKYGYVKKYIQFLVMYDLQWKFKAENFPAFLSKEEIDLSNLKLRQLLKYIDDEIILQQRFINIFLKLHILKIKYGKNEFHELLDMVFLKEDLLVYFNQKLLASAVDQYVFVDFIEIRNNTVFVEGYVHSIIQEENFDLIVTTDGSISNYEIVSRESIKIKSLSKVVQNFKSFKCSYELLSSGKTNLSFYMKLGETIMPLNLRFGLFTGLKGKVKQFNVSRKKHIISVEGKEIIIERKNLSVVKHIIRKEKKLFCDVKKKQNINEYKVLISRGIVYLLRLFYRKDIWLFMDRIDKANDNAEYLYRHANSKKDKIRKYFVVDKASSDFDRLSKVGKVVNVGSFKHKILHLLANKVISSHIDEWVINPFFGMRKFYNDLFQYKFVFLQHGVIQGELSHWLNKYKQNISLFITSSPYELKALESNEYGYDSSVLKLTGLPRFDGLNDEKKKQILIMPTWRQNLVAQLNQKTGIRPYNNSFKDSQYFTFFNNLINDNRLIEASRKNGYDLVFFPHPNIHQQIHDFTKNKQVKFLNYDFSYQKLFNESSLLITDYSSVAFDFAYLKKPLIYAQFENYHFEPGYFNYREMGFGEVCKEYDGLVDAIIEYIENDCQMKDIYQKRVDRFYAYVDRNNSERVYNEIRKLEY
ncbi:bifunctional glycosyltransferase/CDP-glycerol:glycerophosphate glycerophosphotransferase [Paenibacillus illinoisensis]|uniref:bifunctional glycosyltransferase/CDP-glycerol:glycerophosphate glycerophosphotransferase n=1 Tax=Paenibacillus illinoisensis TaxID=59845 RepID=UPI003D27933C